MNKPVVAVTMGDPAGVGPEITVKTFAETRAYDRSQPFVIGTVASLEQAREETGVIWNSPA